jgi:hypothetical protein
VADKPEGKDKDTGKPGPEPTPEPTLEPAPEPTEEPDLEPVPTETPAEDTPDPLPTTETPTPTPTATSSPDPLPTLMEDSSGDGWDSGSSIESPAPLGDTITGESTESLAELPAIIAEDPEEVQDGPEPLANSLSHIAVSPVDPSLVEPVTEEKTEEPDLALLKSFWIISSAASLGILAAGGAVIWRELRR